MLHQNRIEDWDCLYMMPNAMRNRIKSQDDLRKYVSEYKYDARAKISAKRTILANIGDMWHDLVKYPLSDAHRQLCDVTPDECAIFFPASGHHEVAVKLHGNTG